MLFGLLLAAFIGQAPAGGVPAHLIFLPADTVVEAVTCDQWERWDHNDRELWRTNYGAVIVTDAGEKHLQSGDVSEGSAPGLWFTIEWQCSPEYGAGIWDDS